jgi:hypothetical protein
MDYAIKNGVGQCGIADDLMPAADRYLTGNHQGATAVTILGDLEEVAAVISG